MQAIRNFVDAIFYPFRMIARLPSQIVSSPRRMLGLSLPVRAAILLGIGLLAIITAWSIFIWTLDGREQFWSFLKEELWILISLAIVIPIVVAVALKLWIEGEPSPFPEIENLWNTAVDEMGRQGVDPTRTPIFLVLGLHDDAANDCFFRAIEESLPVRVPGGGGAIRVMAGPDAIFISCTDTSCLSRCLSAAGSTPVTPAISTGAVAANLSQTMVIGGAAPAPQVPQPPESPTGAFPVSQTAPLPGSIPSPGLGQIPTAAPNTASSIGSTMAIPDMPGTDPQAGLSSAPVAAPTSQRLDPRELQTMSARLQFLCHCIRKRRDPLVPINGIVVSTPFRTVVETPGDFVSQMQAALVNDLSTIRGSARIRCGVTHVVTGMHEEPGFCELIRRIGSDKIGAQRFGKRFGLWNTPTSTQLDALVAHACGAFEDWCYHLFRGSGSQADRGNRQLYRLLCRVRSQLTPRLREIIKSAYSVHPTGSDRYQTEPLLFAGCDFAADGATPDLQAFMRGVFDKMQQQEEDLEWGSEAIAEEARSQSVVRVMLVASGIAIAAITAMLVHAKVWAEP